MKALSTALALVLLGGCTPTNPPPFRTNSDLNSNNIQELHIQSDFPILHLPNAPRGGAHPVGGPAHVFLQVANPIIHEVGVKAFLHTPRVHDISSDNTILPALIDVNSEFANVYDAVAAGSRAGGLDASISIPIRSGLPFGELFIAGPPFGFEPDEFLAYLYQGGGLELQQSLYDEYFNKNLVVIPVAITPTQVAGYFPEPIPDPETLNISAKQAMANLCAKPWVTRWPVPAAGVWAQACDAVGIKTKFIGTGTRCTDPNTTCPSEKNPQKEPINTLTFGGFVPGVAPHSMAKNGNVDVYELNLPSTDIQMIKMVTKQTHKTNEQSDLTSVIEKAPYLYGGAWHQQLTYIELIINRKRWDELSVIQRHHIKSAAKIATLENYVTAMHDQNEAVEILQKNGALLMQWPRALLDLLREHSDDYLIRYAADLESKGDSSYLRVLNNMRAYQKSQATFSDFGDVNQGSVELPMYPTQ